MTNPFLTLEGVSYVLPDGRPLFSSLDAHFDLQPTALVGRNGVGKSVLTRLLAGQLSPSAGRCLRSGRVHLLHQRSTPKPGETVAQLAGAAPVLDALARIAGGSVAAADFEQVGDGWDTAARLAAALERQGLGGLAPEHPVAALSGGEAMQVALAGAWLSQADFLILDEPSNHLDRGARARLCEQLQGWPRGLLVVSHGRALLDTMARIVELSPRGLRSYGGGHALYARQRAHVQAQAETRLAQRKHERRRGEQALRVQQERRERRQARGDREGREANQAPILLGGARQRSQASAGRQAQLHDALRTRLDARVSEAAAEVAPQVEVVLRLPPAVSQGHRLARLDGVVLPFAAAGGQALDLQLDGRPRIGVVGPNGSGKSTLLQVLAGRLPPLAGHCRVQGPVAWLDQHHGGLDPARSAFAQLQDADPGADPAGLRTRLAQLGLDAARAELPSAALSGGERLKAALACVLYASRPASLLLLDEPGNHLDLESLQALETMLRAYAGALLVVSHDDALLERLALSHRLDTGAARWRLAPW